MCDSLIAMISKSPHSWQILLSTVLVHNFLWLGMLSGCSSSATHTSADSPDSRQETISLTQKIQVNRYALKNGLRLLVVEDHSSPTFAYQTWFKVGSHDEQKGKTGLAHLFEHMMFKGTTRLPDGGFGRLAESVGTQGQNAFTSRDFTAYIQELPLLKGQRDNLELIAEAEADRMTNLVVNEASFKTELEVVQNERRMRNENSPDGLMDQELFNLAFTQHPYHWPVIGYQEDLNRMSVQDAVDFYKSHYSPNHATIIVVGDVVPNKVLDIVQKYYGELASAPSQVSSNLKIEVEPPQTSPRRKQLRLNIQVEKLLVGYHTPAFSHEDTAALDVLQVILSGGKSSRLNQALVETGIASAAEAFGFEDKDPSLFVAAVNLQKKKRAAVAESIILREFKRLADEKISPEELERAINRMNFRFFGGLETSYEKAYFLGHYETGAGDFIAGIEHQKKIQTVTPEDIQRVTRLYLDPKNRTVITGVPK